MGLQFLQSLLYQTIIVEERRTFSPIHLMILGPKNNRGYAHPIDPKGGVEVEILYLTNLSSNEDITESSMSVNL